MSQNKYDRQLRLWGPIGQKLLSSSKIALLNADAAGTEALKNLVLPGIGEFVIIDSASVSPEDLSTNFFLTEKELGCNRGEAAAKYLLDLNADVVGSSISTNPLELGIDLHNPIAHWCLIVHV